MNWCNFCRTMHPGGDRKPGCPNPDNSTGRLDTMPFPVGAESRERAMNETAKRLRERVGSFWGKLNGNEGE